MRIFFPLTTSATERDVEVVVSERELKVIVFGEERLSGRLAGEITYWYVDLAENGKHLQLNLVPAEDVEWDTLFVPCPTVFGFRVGSTVAIQGVLAKPELNGQTRCAGSGAGASEAGERGQGGSEADQPD